MGYNVGVYCDPSVYNNPDLIFEVNQEPRFWATTHFTGKDGYYFYGDYRTYFEKSIFYQICIYLNVNLYRYFDPLNYAPLDSSIPQHTGEYKWFDLQEVNLNMNQFLFKLKSIDITILLELVENCEGHSKPRFENYFNTLMFAELLQAIQFIDLFKKYGAQLIIFGYD